MKLLAQFGLVVTLLGLSLILCQAKDSSAALDLPKKDSYKCGVCTQFIDMVTAKIAQADIDHPYQVRTRYRLDEKKSLPYSRSDTFLYSLLEPKARDEWYEGVSFFRSPAPVRLVHKSEKVEDTRLISHPKAIKAAKRVHSEMVEQHEEKLVAAFKKERVIDDIKRDICVDFLKGMLIAITFTI